MILTNYAFTLEKQNNQRINSWELIFDNKLNWKLQYKYVKHKFSTPTAIKDISCQKSLCILYYSPIVPNTYKNNKPFFFTTKKKLFTIRIPRNIQTLFKMRDSKHKLRGNYICAKFCYIFVKLVYLVKGLNFGTTDLTKLKCAELKQFQFSIVIR